MSDVKLKTYTVQSGDNLWKIAKKQGIKQKDINFWGQKIAKQNNIENLNKINVGQQILLDTNETSSTQDNSLSHISKPENTKSAALVSEHKTKGLIPQNPAEKTPQPGKKYFIFIDAAGKDIQQGNIDGKAFTENIAGNADNKIILKLPTKKQVLDTIKSTVSKIKPEDELSVAYRGHGIQRGLGYEGVNDPREGLYLSNKECIADNELATAFKKMPKNSNLVFMADACKSGGLFTGKDDLKAVTAKQGINFIGLASASDTQKASSFNSLLRTVDDLFKNPVRTIFSFFQHNQNSITGESLKKAVTGKHFIFWDEGGASKKAVTGKHFWDEKLFNSELQFTSNMSDEKLKHFEI
ncbi:MAG: LysM peptidoglycan-binding domain-containing protein [bacterium]